MKNIFNNIFTETLTELSSDFSQKDSSKNEYINQIYSRYINTIEEFDKLLNIYSQIKKINLTESNALEFLNYHYEYFIIKAITVTDTCARLINDVYELNLKGNSINIEKFNKKSSILNEELLTFLNNFFGQYQTLKNDDRNYIIHEGGFKNKIIDSIESNLLFKQLIETNKITKMNYISPNDNLEFLYFKIEDLISNMEKSIVMLLELITNDFKSIYQKKNQPLTKGVFHAGLLPD